MLRGLVKVAVFPARKVDEVDRVTEEYSVIIVGDGGT
jgi:cation transport ATPase